MRIIHLLKHGVRGNGHVHVAVDLACAQADTGHDVVFAAARSSYEDVLRAHGVEVVADPAGTTTEEAAAEFRSHTAANHLFEGELALEGSHELTHAYPIYVHGSSERAARAQQELRDLGIESFGRHGAFRYQPTARVSTLDAETALAAR